MKLPNADQAVLAREKLTDYLLSSTHPVGKAKARFFRALGYDEGDAERLAAEFLAMAASQEVSGTEDSGFGTKYVTDGLLPSPDGGGLARTVWMVENGKDFPRFVTAYPL